MAGASSSLPEDLVSEILLRLPLKTVLRFRCVSKCWFNLTKSVYFINGHYEKGHNRSVLLLHHCLWEWKLKRSRNLEQHGRFKLLNRVTKLSFHDMDSPELEECYTDLVIPETLERRLKNPITLCGPSKGLIGLVCDIYDTHSSNIHSNVVICNPTLRQFKLLPQCPCSDLSRPRRGTWASGLGTTSSNSFKVVHIHVVDDQVLDCNIYDSTTNTWIQFCIDEFKMTLPYRGYIVESACFLNGFCHWYIKEKSRNLQTCTRVILTCDISTGIMGYFKVPNALMSQLSEIFQEHLMILNECISIVWCPYINDQQSCEIWVMKEYGVRNSWTKQYVIPLNMVGFPLSFSKNDELLQLNGGTLTCYDLVANQFKPFKVTLRPCDALIYQESLVNL